MSAMVKTRRSVGQPACPLCGKSRHRVEGAVGGLVWMSSRPPASYDPCDNFLRDFGERFVPGYKTISAVDLLMNIIAAFTPEWRHVAVIWAVFFAYSLAAGRIVSLIVDGMPSPILLFSLAVELTVGTVGLLMLNRERREGRVP
jgi:Domain of unknown function (DUF4345)